MTGIKEFIARNEEYGIEIVDLRCILYELRHIAFDNGYYNAMSFMNGMLDELDNEESNS